MPTDLKPLGWRQSKLVQYKPSMKFWLYKGQNSRYPSCTTGLVLSTPHDSYHFPPPPRPNAPSPTLIFFLYGSPPSSKFLWRPSPVTHLLRDKNDTDPMVLMQELATTRRLTASVVWKCWWPDTCNPGPNSTHPNACSDFKIEKNVPNGNSLRQKWHD